ncbi:hypothetical protein [Wolbachia endosymbiont (group A) of Myopa testacea]|uniref:hypothetical protein n=1 Tax=Wolbachia endosymbiont (group A) of Myopa testacea TaxID=3066148 RepID=UPI0033405B77
MEKRSTLNFEENFCITSVQLRRKDTFANFKLLSRWISNNKQRIIDILLPIAGLKSIKHEIEGSIIALKGAENEVITSNPGVVNSIGVFHSSNALLYEYVIDSCNNVAINFGPLFHCV